MIKQITKYKSKLETLEETHIQILEERFLFAASRREKMLEDNPNLTDTELWAVDHDLATKKLDLEIALDDQRRRRRRSNQQ